MDLALKIFKTDVPTLKGKSTAPRPPVVTTEYIIELPDELKHNGGKIELSIDVVYINDQSFLQSVDRTIKLKLVTALQTRKKGENYDSKLLYEGIDNVLRHHNKDNILISCIHANSEFKTLLSKLNHGWDVNMNFSLPGAHVPDIERANCVLQERFQTALYHLPFKLIPQAMIKFLSLRVTRHVN